MLTKTDLFVAEAEGYHSCRIPGLLVTPCGSLLATCEARRGHGGDYDDSDIRLRRSADGGQTWEPSRAVVCNRDYGPGPIHNFALVGDRDTGAVHAVYSHDYARLFYRRSDDDGASFAPPIDLTAVAARWRHAYPWVVVAAGPGHGVQLRGGRLLFPVWLSTDRSHRPSAVTTLYSDDHGQTWQAGEFVCRHGDRADGGEEIVNPSETTLAELPDGRVLLNIRNESAPHRRLASWSAAGGAGWSRPAFQAALREPICLGSMNFRPGRGGEPDCLLFANPDNLDQPESPARQHHRRRQLTLRGSLDEGRTWPLVRVLEPEFSAYSDLGVGAGGQLWCFYERGRQPDRYDLLTLACFDLDWLQKGD